MVILDVCDELGQSIEMKSATPEPAGVGKERSSRDSCHGCCCITNEGSGQRQQRQGSTEKQQESSGGNSWSRAATSYLQTVGERDLPEVDGLAFITKHILL